MKLKIIATSLAKNFSLTKVGCKGMGGGGSWEKGGGLAVLAADCGMQCNINLWQKGKKIKK